MKLIHCIYIIYTFHKIHLFYFLKLFIIYLIKIKIKLIFISCN